MRTPVVYASLAPASLVPFQLYDAALTARPVETRLLTAASLAIAGDALAQLRQGHGYNARRGASFAVCESIYRGFLQPALLLWILSHVTGELALIKRVLVNQFAVSPGIYYPLFWLCTGLIQGLSLPETLSRAKAGFAGLYGRSLLYWLPVNVVQFNFVPERFKVPFLTIMCFGWSLCASMIAGYAQAWRKVQGDDAERRLPSLTGVRGDRRAVAHTHDGDHDDHEEHDDDHTLRAARPEQPATGSDSG